MRSLTLQHIFLSTKTNNYGVIIFYNICYLYSRVWIYQRGNQNW